MEYCRRPAIAGYPYTRFGDLLLGHRTDPSDPANPGATIGVPPPPFENLPNREGEDPHGIPRLAPAEQRLVSDFFAGAIQQTDTCGGGPCYAGSFTGPEDGSLSEVPPSRGLGSGAPRRRRDSSGCRIGPGSAHVPLRVGA